MLAETATACGGLRNPRRMAPGEKALLGADRRQLIFFVSFMAAIRVNIG